MNKKKLTQKERDAINEYSDILSDAVATKMSVLVSLWRLH